MLSRLRIFLTTLVLASLLAASPVFGKSLSEAVQQVQKDTGGQVLSAKTEIRGGREIHVIKVVTRDGVVKTERITGDKVKENPNAHSTD